MKWTEGTIARAVAQQTLARKCVVLVDNCNWTGHECDVLAVTHDLRVIDIEVKISRADFKADAKKDKWWKRANNWRFTDASGGWAHAGPPTPDLPCEWPRKVWKHYFAMPEEIWTPDLVQFLPSQNCGVLLCRKDDDTDFVRVTSARRAVPCRDADKLTPAQVLDVSRLANLRMWEAYNQRDALKEAK